MTPDRALTRSTIVVFGSNAEDAALIRRTVEEGPYQTTICDCLGDLKNLPSDSWLAVILDIDSIPLDNRTIRGLALALPEVSFFCTSRDRSHPEIKEAICHHLFACLTKPVEPDELHYLLQCVREGEPASRIPPR